MQIQDVMSTALWQRNFQAAARANANGFEQTMSVQAAAQTDEEREAAYIDHLRSKYGAHFRIESIPRDPDVLERLGKSMSGDDVIIAPNIVAKMARDPKTAAYYERTIDHCFETVPADKAKFAAIGLTFEPCGVVVHEDGTVTYICGGGDTPERVAQVNAINAARDAKRAAQRRIWTEERTEHMLEEKRLNEMAAQARLIRAARVSVAGGTGSFAGSTVPAAESMAAASASSPPAGTAPSV